MDEEIKTIIIGITLLVTLVVLITEIVSYAVEKNITCPKFGQSVNLEYKYNFWSGGCFVNYQGQWIPSDNLRAGKLD